MIAFDSSVQSSHPSPDPADYPAIDVADVRLAVNAPATMRGVIAVERLRTYGGYPFNVDAHGERLCRTCNDWGLADWCGRVVQPETVSRLVDHIVLKQTTSPERHRPSGSQDDFGVVILAMPPDNDSMLPRWVAYATPIDHALVRRRIEHGSDLITTRVCVPPPQCVPPRWKVRSRLHYEVADREMAAALAARTDSIGGSFDPVAVLMDVNGHVADTAIASIALIRNGRIRFSDPDRVLEGTTIRVIKRWSEQTNQFDVDQKTGFGIDDLAHADEVWLAGVTAGPWFARTVDGVAIGSTDGSDRPPLFRQMRQWFDEQIAPSQPSASDG